MRAIGILAVVCTLVNSSLAVEAHPRWAVFTSSGKGERYIDQPNCHPLEYFAGDPKNFDYDNDLMNKQSSDIKDSVESMRIGELNGHSIHQVIHNINKGEVVMKMILVERKPGEMCEIYYQQFDAQIVIVEPAYVVNVSSEPVLATDDSVSGTGHFIEEQYWTFDKDGPIALNVRERIKEITTDLLPDGLEVENGGGFEIQALSYTMPVWKPDDAHCCPSGGTVHIQFALKDHHLVVVDRKFGPN
jgi:hypothetical protein